MASNASELSSEDSKWPVSSKTQNLWVTESLGVGLLKVFMCTGFMRDTSQYFMKASPVRPGNYINGLMG